MFTSGLIKKEYGYGKRYKNIQRTNFGIGIIGNRRIPVPGTETSSGLRFLFSRFIGYRRTLVFKKLSQVINNRLHTGHFHLELQFSI